MWVIVSELWYSTSGHPAEQGCWSLRVSLHFLASSVPSSLHSSLMCSFQPSPSKQSLIHFLSNSLSSLWFICLWSLLTLSNTFPFFRLFSVFPHLSFGRALGSCKEYQLLCFCLITVFQFLSRHHFKAGKKEKNKFCSLRCLLVNSGFDKD